MLRVQQQGIKTETCHYCQESIDDIKYLHVDFRSFHMDHFKCHSCKKDINDIGYYEYDKNLYCEACYYKANHTPCTVCHKQIYDRSIIFAENKHYHDKHFICSICNRFLKDKESTGDFCKIDGQLFCTPCFITQDIRCSKCDERLGNEYVKVLSGIYHKSCVNCSICGDVLNEHCTSKGSIMFHMTCYLKQTYKQCKHCQDYVVDEEYFEIDTGDVYCI